MKYIVFFVILLLVVLWQAGGQTAPSLVLPTPIPTPTLQPTSSLPTVSFQGQTYSYALFRMPASAALTLIPNYSDRQSFATITGANYCVAAINGGFYQTNNKPLGWFVAEGKTLLSPVQSTLFNGFLVIEKNGQASIGQESSTAAYYGLQAGPLLLYNAEGRTLRILEDEQARRSVVASASDGRIILLSVFSPEQVFEGPYLEDLPEVMSLISKKETLDLKNAMNLDGGSASAFLGGETRLGELTYVGSVLCAK